MPPKLLKLAALYRAAHLFAQQCHWIVTGPTFAQDHAFFSDLYTAYAEAVDDLVEKAIGTAGGIAVYDGEAFHSGVMTALRPALNLRDRAAMLAHAQKIEDQLQASLQTLSAGADLGTGDLLQKLAGDSQHRSYLIRGFLEGGVNDPGELPPLTAPKSSTAASGG